jgi:hypothetical protein
MQIEEWCKFHGIKFTPAKRPTEELNARSRAWLKKKLSERTWDFDLPEELPPSPPKKGNTL